MEYNVNTIRKDTVALISQINKQISEVEREAQALGVESHQLRDHHGDMPLNQLLQAKATAYNTLVMLQTGENRSGRQRSRPQ